MAAGGTMAAGGMMAAPATATMAPDETARRWPPTCAEHPDMMLGEAMGMLPQ